MHDVTLHPINADTDREAWLALRRRYLSATDWPKLTGSSPWAGEAEVLADKLGAGGEAVWSLPMQVGKAMEPLLVDQALRLLGEGEPVTQAFLSRGHLGFTPDLLLVKEGEWTLAEFKVSVKPWHGAVPPDYLDQVRFQATVLGLGEVQVIHLQLASWQEGLAFLEAGSVPGDRLEIYRVPVEAAERKRIGRRAEAWWARHFGDQARLAG